MKVERHYYSPTPEQRAELGAKAVELRARRQSSRILRTMREEFMSAGWRESEAGRLAQVHLDIHGAG